MLAAKAWAALIGSMLTVLFTSDAIAMDGTVHTAIGVVVALLTAFATYTVPNKKKGVLD